jgi:hypothetical protein
MTAEMAVQTAKNIFLLLKDVTTNNEAEWEQVFIQALAPEILGPARMENLAAQQIVKDWCDYDCSDELRELRERYDITHRPAIHLPAQTESQQTEDSANV